MFTSFRLGRLLGIAIAIATGALTSCALPTPDSDQEHAAEPDTDAAQSDIRTSAPRPDCLYVGDNIVGPGMTDQIERFDPFTGAYFGSFIKEGEMAPLSVRGMVFDRRKGVNPDLVVVDQSAATSDFGQVLRYRKSNGKLEDILVPPNEPKAPFAPRGVIIHHGILYVADVGDDDPVQPGRIRLYNAKTGKPLGTLNGKAFPQNRGPRGLVIGPDGYLYATVFNHVDPADGQVVRFDPRTGKFLGVFIDSEKCGCELSRPEGLVFGPDGNLYVMTILGTEAANFRSRILIFDGKKGRLRDQIKLGDAGESRANAQALLFGPEGKLYVPITGGSTTTTGQLRVYDVTTETFTLLAQAGGPLQQPFYLTFCGTDPATLAYSPRRHCGCGK